jgi:thioredoxin 1
MADNVREIDDAGFDEVISQGVTLVDFWAEWCMPCRMQAPIMDELAVKLEGRATVGKVNVDENPNTASKFGITGIPTSILFKDGAEAQRFVGVQSEEVLKKAVEDRIGS